MANLVRIYADDKETTPLATFETPVNVADVRATLGLGRGGVKRRGGAENYVSLLAPGGEYSLLGGPKFIIYVTFLGVNGMINVKSPKAKLRTLFNDIVAHFDGKVPVPAGEELKIAELVANGCVLNPNEPIDALLTDGQSVEAVDFKKWLDRMLATCTKVHAKLLQSDFAEPPQFASSAAEAAIDMAEEFAARLRLLCCTLSCDPAFRKARTGMLTQSYTSMLEAEKYPLQHFSDSSPPALLRQSVSS